MRQRDRGAALIVAMVVIIVIAGMATALINMASTRSKGVNDRMDEFRAFQAAQGAVDRVMAQLADPNIGPTRAGFGEQFLSDARIGALAPIDGAVNVSRDVATIGGVEHFAVVGDAGNGTYKIVAAARIGNSERVIEVIVKPPASQGLPGPFPPSGADSFGAMGLFGDARNASIKIPNTLDGGSVSGLDAAGVNDVLGVALGHRSVYEDVMGSLSAADADVFDGSTTSTYNGVTTSIDVASGATVDAAKIQEYADAINSTASALVADTSITSPSGNDPLIQTGLTGVTRIDEMVTLKAGDIIEGSGTLIITERFTVQGGTLDWDGDVIILGGSGGTELNVKSGFVTIEPDEVIAADGTVTMVGGSLITIGNGQGPAGVSLNGGTTSIEGAIFIASTDGPGANSSTFHVNKGDTALAGLLMAMGNKVSLKIMPNTGDSFSMEGGLILAVPETESAGPDKMTVWLKGETSLQFHSINVDNALTIMKGIFDEYAPDVDPPVQSGAFDIVVWREK